MSNSGRGDTGDRYDWLYDGPSDETAAQPVAASGAPTSSSASSELPPPQLPPPGRSPAKAAPTPRGAGPKRPRSKKRRIGLVVLAVLLAWIVFLVAVPFWAWGKVNKVEAWPSGARPAEQPGTTYLLIGSDRRTGEKARGRTDTIMLLHWGSGPTVLTSIPRDSLVPIPGRGTSKINAAYAWGGAPLLIRTIESDTGVRIDGFVEIGFHGLVDVVNAVGGIQVCPDKALRDPLAHLNIQAGCQEVDGKTALAYSRARHSRANGDVGRAEAQREVIGSIGSSVRSPSTFLNPWKYARVAGSTADSISVDDDMSMLGFASFGWKLSGALGGGGLSCTVPLANLSVKWDRDRALKFFGHIKNDTTDQLGSLCTADGFEK